jgi:hypothetical protein
MATTLLVAVLTPSGDLHAAQVGDGCIVGMDTQGTLQRLVEPDPTTRYANEVRPLTEAAAPMRIASHAGVCAVALTTDGLEAVALDGAGPFGGFWGPLFRFVVEAEERATVRDALGSWLRSGTITSITDDDCTLAFGWTHEGVARLTTREATA